jgi:hypothetical protein
MAPIPLGQTEPLPLKATPDEAMTAAAPGGDAGAATLFTRAAAAAATAPLAAAVGAVTAATTAVATAAAMGAKLLGVETRDAPAAEGEAEGKTEATGSPQE